MKKEQFVLIAIYLTAILATAMNNGKCEEPIKREEVCIKQLAEANLPEEMANAYKAIFNKSSKKGLANLKNNVHNSVSIRASWEEVLRSQRLPKEVNSSNVNAETAMAISRFLGFIEGRLGVTPPDWWERAVVNSKFDLDGRLIPSSDIKKIYHSVRVDGREVSMPANQSIREENKSLIVEQNLKQFPLSESIWREYIETSECLCVLIDGDFCYIAPHTTSGNSYPIVAIERSTGKAKWSTQVCDFTSQDNSTSGFWREYVHIGRQGDSLFIFGSGVFNFYLECFDVKTGKSRFRFCSFYKAEMKP